MAQLLSTKIKGWLGSVGTFISGFTGQGWRIWKRNDRWHLEIDDMTVRGTVSIFELLIQKIRAIKGALGISQACGKIKEITEDATNYYITVEDENSFMANDFIRCQQRSASGVRGYWVEVDSIYENSIVVAKSEFTESGIPVVGDDIVQFGNSLNEARQSAIYLHADENGIPAIDVLFGINSKSFEGKNRVTLGGFADNENVRHFGLSCVNGLLESRETNGDVNYRINPDGSGFFAMGNIAWSKDGSGSIAAGNIAWDANGNGYLFKDTNGVAAISWTSSGLTFGSNVTLQWSNLSAEAKANLKGEAGQKQPYYKYDFTNSTSVTATGEPVGASWQDAPPAAVSGSYLWMRTTYYTAKTDNTGWDASSPTYTRLSGLNGSAAPQVRAQYSINGIDYWHTVFTTGDIYMRLSYDNGSTWTSAVRIVGEKGTNAPAAKPQYSVDGSTLWHDTFALGDIWMKLSVDGGTTYGSAVRIVGEKGDIGAAGQKQIYYKYDFSYSPSLSGTPTGVTWVDAPPAAVAGQYLWMRTTIYTPKADNSGWDAGTPTYSRLGGENGSNGASPYALDLTNENVSLPATSAGVVLDYSTAFTNFNLYLGSSIVSAAYSIVASSGVTATLDSANKKITVTELITDTATVTLYAKNGDGTITYGTAVFTLSKVKNGESSVIYSLLPLVSAIKRGKDGATIPLSITCSKLKRVGSADPATTTEMSLVYTTSANATETAYSGAIKIGATWTWIEFILKNGTTVLDRERVPIVKDGSDGIDGIDGIDGDSPYQLVLSNQMASITLNADGTLNYSDAVTTPTLYCGLQAVPDVTYNFTAQDSVEASMTSGAISVTSVTNEYTNLEITATLQGGSTPIAKVLFKVVKVKSAVTYEIIPSVRWVKKSKTGEYSVPSVLFSVYRIVGNLRTQVTNVSTDSVKMVIKRDDINRVVVDGYGGNSYDFADAVIQVAPSGSPMTSSIVAKLYPAIATWNDADLLDMQTVPLLIDGVDGNPGADANLLPWVQEWNTNQTEVGSDHLISPKIFSGTKDPTTGALTGVAMGRGVISIGGVAKTGVFGIKDGVVTFMIDAETGDVSGDGRFSAGDENGKVVLDPSRKGTILYDSSGKEIGRFGFKETSSNNFDFSAGEMDLYLYTNGVLTGTAKLTFDELLIQALGTTWFHVKRCTTDLGTWSEVYANLPTYPTVALGDIPIGAMFIDANSSHVVKVRHT